MSQTKAGAIKARQTMREKYGDDYYAVIGKRGGKAGRTGGFYNDPDRARAAGKKGGRISRRRANENKV